MIQNVVTCDICQNSDTLINNELPDGWEAAFDSKGIFIQHTCTYCHSEKNLRRLLTLKHLLPEDKKTIENFILPGVPEHHDWFLKTEMRRLTHKYCSRPGGVINEEPPITRVAKK